MKLLSTTLFMFRQMYSENSKKVKEEYNFVLSRSPPLTHVRMQYKTFRPPQGF